MKQMMTASVPASLVNDYMTFMGYVEANEVQLTKGKQWLSRKNLTVINERMTEPEQGLSTMSDQDAYPLLHLCYHLSLAAGLARIAENTKGKLTLQSTERLALFKEFTVVEKYMCLLETLWMDTNWSKIQYKSNRSPDDCIIYLFEELERSPKNEVIRCGIQGLNADRFLWEMNYFMHYFRYFGFWELTKDEEKSSQFGEKYRYFPKTITRTPLYDQLVPIFREIRDIEDWNLRMIRESGDWRAQLDEPFIEAFVPLFSKGELVRSLPRNSGEFFDGSYTLKVALDNNCWRTICLSSHTTLHQLHKAIQDMYDFNDDHLYAYFMDGECWSRTFAFYSPDDGEEPSADGAMLGELSLSIGQSFLYLFDYGDEWHFWVTVEGISQADTRQQKFQLMKKKGVAPEQYRW